jgi:hypothetical protein
MRFVHSRKARSKVYKHCRMNGSTRPVAITSRGMRGRSASPDVRYGLRDPSAAPEVRCCGRDLIQVASHLRL